MKKRAGLAAVRQKRHPGHFYGPPGGTAAGDGSAEYRWAGSAGSGAWPRAALRCGCSCRRRLPQKAGVAKDALDIRQTIRRNDSPIADHGAATSIKLALLKEVTDGARRNAQQTCRFGNNQKSLFSHMLITLGVFVCQQSNLLHSGRCYFRAAESPTKTPSNSRRRTKKK